MTDVNQKIHREVDLAVQLICQRVKQCLPLTALGNGLLEQLLRGCERGVGKQHARKKKSCSTSSLEKKKS